MSVLSQMLTTFAHFGYAPKRVPHIRIITAAFTDWSQPKALFRGGDAYAIFTATSQPLATEKVAFL